MAGKIHIHVDKGMMPRSGILHKPLWVLLDNAVIGDIGWGHTKDYEVPAGAHSIAVQNKRSDTSCPAIGIVVPDGETADIDCLMDTAGRLHIVDKKGKTPVNIDAIPYNGSAKEQAKQKTGHQAAFNAICFIGCITLLAGLLTRFTSLNLYDKSAVPFLLAGGLVFFALGFFIRRKSFISLILAVFLYGMDTVSLVLAFIRGYRAAIGGVMMHIVLMAALLRGIKATWILNQKKSYGNEPAARVCPQCGASVPAGVDVCGGCKTPVAASGQYQPVIVRKGSMFRYKLLGVALGLLVILAVFLFTAGSFR
jgi:hypothetical protein